jgi:hypothetical protein
LHQLSVFADGWALEAAIAVCGGDNDVAIIDGLGSLVAKSLVTVNEVGAGELRYGMLETVRLYAQERLVETGGAEQLRDRHSDWVMQLIAGPGRAPTLAATSARLAPELENLRAALDWSREQERADVITMLIAGSWVLWWEGLRSFEALGWLDSYAVPADESLPTAVRVEWRIARGFFLQETLNGREIQRCGEEALALDPEGQASPLTGLAWFLRMMMPLALNPPDAMRIGREAVEWLAARSDAEVADWVRSYYAVVLIANDDLLPARTILNSLLDSERFDALGHWQRSALATISHIMGDNDQSAAQLQAKIAALPEFPSRHTDTWSYGQLAIAEAGRGNRHDSRAALRASVACVRRRYTHIPSAWGLPVTAAAIVLAIEGRDSEAMQLLVAVGAEGRSWQARQETTFVLHKRYSAQLADRMSREAFASAWTSGARMTVDEMCDRVDALAAET